MTRTIRKTTDQLSVGDVLLCHGMHVLLDTPGTTFRSSVDSRTGVARAVYVWPGTVLNPDDVRADAMLWSFLHEDVWVEGEGWVSRFTGRWTVQGNELAGWTVDQDLTATHYARQLGAQHGASAASSMFDGNTDRATYERVARGLDEGDPAVLDSLPTADLSGEWADDLTSSKLFADALARASLEDTDEEHDDLYDCVCSAYEEGFSDALQAEVERVVREQLACLLCGERPAAPGEDNCEECAAELADQPE